MNETLQVINFLLNASDQKGQEIARLQGEVRKLQDQVKQLSPTPPTPTQTDIAQS